MSTHKGDVLMSKINQAMYCKATVLWDSGRTEEFKDKLNKDGKPPKKFNDKVKQLNNFPTVKIVQVERF